MAWELEPQTQPAALSSGTILDDDNLGRGRRRNLLKMLLRYRSRTFQYATALREDAVPGNHPSQAVRRFR